jgi:hypothetical protein
MAGARPDPPSAARARLGEGAELAQTFEQCCPPPHAGFRGLAHHPDDRRKVTPPFSDFDVAVIRSERGVIAGGHRGTVWRTPIQRDVRPSQPGAAPRRPGRAPGVRRLSRAARQLRRIAEAREERDPLRRRSVLLRADRVAAVRAELLELALLVELAKAIDPDCWRELNRLLTSGCDSPLYNPEIHMSELRATLFFLRSRLMASPARSHHARHPS